MKSQRQIKREYEKLLKDVITNDFYKVHLEKQINCYVCNCGHITKTINIDSGVIPFTLSCEECGNVSRSSYFRDIVPEQSPTIEWYRPTLKQCYKLRNEEGMLEHILIGGLDNRMILNKEI